MPQSAPAVAPPAPKPRRLAKLFGVSTAALVLAAGFAGYAVMRGQEVKSVSPTGSIEFYSSGGGTEFSSEEIKQRQGNMDERISQLEHRAQESAEADPDPVVTSVDISGTWFGANGLSYEIAQFGAEAVIQEISTFGVTATGYGAVDGTRAVFRYEAIDGSTGVADLELVDDGTLSGTFRNDAFGTSVRAELTR